MTFSRSILMVKCFGNRSSVQAAMCLESDSMHDVTAVYTTTCTGAADQQQYVNKLAGRQEQAVCLCMQT